MKSETYRLLHVLALTPFLLGLALAQPPDSTAAMGQKFTEPKSANLLRVLLVGSGSSHDFPKLFLGTDKETLMRTGTMDVAATPNLLEALAMIPQADVLVFSGNHAQYGSDEFQTALNQMADAKKGLVFLHAATWDHPSWKGYNDRFISGKTPSHGKGYFEVTVKDSKSPITNGLPEKFMIDDENYRFEPGPKSKLVLVAENAPDGGENPHPSVWTVNDEKTRIVCTTLGHDGPAHDNPAYKTILVNAVNWVGGRSAGPPNQ